MSDRIKLVGEEPPKGETKIYLALENGIDGISIVAFDEDGVDLYRILSINEKGLHLHQLQNFGGQTPFPLIASVRKERPDALVIKTYKD